MGKFERKHSDLSKIPSKKSFEEGKYAVSFIDEKEFYQARKSLEARSKRLTEKQGKENKSNAVEALIDDEVNILCTKNIYTSFLKKRQGACTQTE